MAAPSQISGRETTRFPNTHLSVMAGLDPAIHVYEITRKAWITGSRAFGAAR
jgi:hypothetical protein